MSRMPMPVDDERSIDDLSNGPAAADLFDDSAEGEERRALLRRLEQVETLFDRNFPVLGIRFGYDAILGLVPVAGDTVGAAVAAWIFWKAQKLGVPAHLKGRMLSNIVFDYVLGAIPLVGTIVDVAFKANTRNIRLLKEHLYEEERQSAAAGARERRRA